MADSKKVSLGPRAPRKRHYFEEEKKSEDPVEVKASKTWMDRYHLKLDKVQELFESDEECPSPAKKPKIEKKESKKPNLRAVIAQEEKKEAALPKPRPTTIKEVLQMELDEKKKRKRRSPAGNKR